MPAVEKLRNIILSNIADGFAEQMAHGMISYVIPFSKYPRGYHVNKNEPLPYISLSSQKRHIALYHTGLYMNTALRDWFVEEYAKQVSARLDMGKSCIRFKNPDSIPYDVIAQLCRKMSVDEYISFYELALKR